MNDKDNNFIQPDENENVSASDSQPDMQLAENAEDTTSTQNTESSEQDKKGIDSNKIMAILAYIFALIPYFFADKNDKIVQFHTIQGINLFIYAFSGAVIAYIISFIIPFLPWLPNLWGLIALVFSIIGIINVCNNETKELPIISKYKIINK